MRTQAHAPARLYDLSWRRREMAALAALCLLGGALSAGKMLTRSRRFDPSQPGPANRVAAAAEAIDPNTASAASLRRLPNIGEVRARAILAYRRVHGPHAFGAPADLQRVEGIGPGIVDAIRRYLRFSRAR